MDGFEEDIFTRSGYVEPGHELDFESTYSDIGRTTTGGSRKPPEEIRKLQRNPEEYAKYRLGYEVYEIPPFDRIEINRDDVFRHLNRFPSLETYNIPLLVAAYLYRVKHPRGKVQASEFAEFYKPFKNTFNEVDLWRYIVVYDRFVAKKK